MEYLKNILNGIVIGIANIIPGVSGGTMALVMGFYERLINAIHNISLNTIKISIGILSFKKEKLEKLKEEFKHIDGTFLCTLTFGAALAIVALANVMKYLINNHHEPTYGFFFGLVLISAIAPYRMIKKLSVATVVSAFIAIFSILLISNSISSEEKIQNARTKYEIKLKNENSGKNINTETGKNISVTHAFYLFILGSISISAMILPGVSGSFLLLLMGGYFEILTAIAERDFLIIFIFGFGCLIGVTFFSRLLNYMLNRWHDITISSLLGLVIGSLWIIWPFKYSHKIGNEIIYLSNKLPDDIGAIEIYTLLTMAAGMGVVAIFIYIESKRVKVY